MAEGNTTVSVAADKKSGVASGNAEEGGAVIGAATVGAALGLSTSGRQAVTYTDEAGVDYYMDSNGQWWYYPSPTPMPTPEPVPAGPGSSIAIDELSSEASGDNAVTVGATEDKAAGAANGMNGAMAAAAVSPGAPGAIGLAF